MVSYKAIFWGLLLVIVGEEWGRSSGKQIIFYIFWRSEGRPTSTRMRQMSDIECTTTTTSM